MDDFVPHTQSRWNEWLTTEATGKLNFQGNGDRISELRDASLGTGWKPYDNDAQVMLRELFSAMDRVSSASQEAMLDCLCWNYRVKLDRFHTNHNDFEGAPFDAIGSRLADSEVSRSSKRWIRLATQLRA